MLRVIVTLPLCLFIGAITNPLLASPLAYPHLDVEAVHLGDNLVQYTLFAHNPLGGAVFVQITSEGEIHQVPTSGVESPPDGGADLYKEAFDANENDTTYQMGGGLEKDSWYDNRDMDMVVTASEALPPFSLVISDGAVGGYVNGERFSYSAGTPDMVEVPESFRIGQIVIVDTGVVDFPAGPLPISTMSGLAELRIVDTVVTLGSLHLPAPSMIAAQGQSFSITGVFSVTSPLVGDVSRDGEVDIADFTLWGDAFGNSGLGMAEDVTADGVVDIGDFTLWADNFGMTAGASGVVANAIPEPSSLILLVVGSLAWGAYLVFRRRAL